MLDLLALLGFAMLVGGALAISLPLGLIVGGGTIFVLALCGHLLGE